MEHVRKLQKSVSDTVRDFPQLLLVMAFVGTISIHGVPSPIGMVTLAGLALLGGVPWIMRKRSTLARPIIPLQIFKFPVVIASLIYFAIGLASFVNASQPSFWYKEVVQRTLIIFFPTLLFTLVPRRPADLKRVFLAYLPFCAFIALVAVWDGRHTGFAKPSYALGMHKNQIAGSCSVMGTIAIAAMLTSQNMKLRWTMAGFLLISILGCFGSQGKAGMMCMVIATLAMFIAVGVKPKRIGYFLLTVALAGGVFWKIMPEEAREHVVSTKKFSTNEIRMTLWTDVLPVVVKDPLSGVGWGQLLLKDDRYYGDAANILLFDWFQMGVLGPIALLCIVFFAVKLPLDNAKRIPKNSVLAFVNCVALGVICGRFFHAMVDSFWIGRGVTLVTWASIGTSMFVKMYLDQTQGRNSKAPALSQGASPSYSKTRV